VPQISRLLQKLEKTNSKYEWPEARVYILAILYGGIAYIQGPKYLLLYCCVLVVIFSVWTTIEMNRKKQIEIVKELIEELRKSRTEPVDADNQITRP
jgi:hypothetical protein